jgi:hypothetical protein
MALVILAIIRAIFRPIALGGKARC